MDILKQKNAANQPSNGISQLSQAGKTPQEMLPYLLSGESDDLSPDIIEKL